MLPYTVKVKYTKGPEQTIALFKQKDEAVEYIFRKLQKDGEMRVETFYQLWELGDLEKSYDQSSLSGEGESGSGGGPGMPGTGGKGSGQSFRPSPTQTSLRPPGMPNNWKDDPEDTKK